MKESIIFKTSVLCIIIGFVFLIFYAEEVDLDLIGEIETAGIEETVMIKGEITRISEHEKVIFIEVDGYTASKTKVIVFNDENVFLEKGDHVELTGVVEQYEGKKEVIADKIVKK